MPPPIEHKDKKGKKIRVGDYVRINDWQMNSIGQISKLHKTSCCVTRSGSEKEISKDLLEKI